MLFLKLITGITTYLNYGKILLRKLMLYLGSEYRHVLDLLLPERLMIISKVLLLD